MAGKACPKPERRLLSGRPAPCTTDLATTSVRSPVVLCHFWPKPFRSPSSEMVHPITGKLVVFRFGAAVHGGSSYHPKWVAGSTVMLLAEAACPAVAGAAFAVGQHFGCYLPNLLRHVSTAATTLERKRKSSRSGIGQPRRLSAPETSSAARSIFVQSRSTIVRESS